MNAVASTTARRGGATTRLQWWRRIDLARRSAYPIATPLSLARWSTTTTTVNPNNNDTASSSSSSNDHHHHQQQQQSSTSNTTDSSSSSSSPRTLLLRAALAQVPEHGWTTEAIIAAVRANQPATVSLSYATTLTETDLIQFFMDDCNRQFQQALMQQQQQQLQYENNKSLVDSLHAALQMRLAMVAPYIRMGWWAQGMAAGMASPAAAWTTTEQLQDLVAICCKAVVADTLLSEVAQFGLGAVYVATECHMLTDESPDFADSWDFLRQQLQQWEALQSSQGNNISLQSAAFLATHVVTALGHGVASVSGFSNLPTPTPNQLWQTAMNTVNTATRTATSSTQKTTNDDDTFKTVP